MFIHRRSFSAVKLKTLYVSKIVSVDGSMKKKCADERRVVARPVELLGQFKAVDMVAAVNVRRVACKGSAAI